MSLELSHRVQCLVCRVSQYCPEVDIHHMLRSRSDIDIATLEPSPRCPRDPETQEDSNQLLQSRTADQAVVTAGGLLSNSVRWLTRFCEPGLRRLVQQAGSGSSNAESRSTDNFVSLTRIAVSSRSRRLAAHAASELFSHHLLHRIDLQLPVCQ